MKYFIQFHAHVVSKLLAYGEVSEATNLFTKGVTVAGELGLRGYYCSQLFTAAVDNSVILPVEISDIIFKILEKCDE